MEGEGKVKGRRGEGRERKGKGQREGERRGGRGGSSTGNFSTPTSKFLARALGRRRVFPSRIDTLVTHGANLGTEKRF
jgi:hypothetical protein